MNCKKKLLTAFVTASLPVLSAWAQEPDKIILHSGDTIKCNVVELSSGEVKYHYPAESLLNVEKMFQVRRIILASGRVIEGEKIRPVLSEADWDKVVVTGDVSKAEGLKYVATIKAKSFTAKSSKASAIDLYELKREAARHQCHLVVLVGNQTVGSSMLFEHEEVSANIYTYPFIGTLTGESTSALLEDVKANPLGSYERGGYKAYRSIMDEIADMDRNTDKDKAESILARIEEYREVTWACPHTSMNDREQFSTACGKLQEAFLKKFSKLKFTSPKQKQQCQDAQ